MLIIIEGPDKCGKSTFIKELEKKGVYDIKHLKFKQKRNWKKQINFYGKIQYSLLLQLKGFLKKKVCISRLFISTLVYSNIFNRQDDLAYIKYSDWEKKCFFIFFDLPFSMLEQNIKKERVLCMRNAKVQYQMFKKILRQFKKHNDNYIIIKNYNYNVKHILNEIDNYEKN